MAIPWTFNKWKKYCKTGEKKNIVKYFTCSKTIIEKLITYANKKWYSQAKVILDSLEEYFLKNK